MPIEPNRRRLAVGPRLRAARQAQQLTIEDVARVTGLTKGFLSRAERDMSALSVASLVTLCDALAIAVGSLFEEPEIEIIRNGEGPRVNLGAVNSDERLITPRTESRVQIVRSNIHPGGHGGTDLYAIAADIDVVHVLQGSITIRFPEESWELHSGDTLTFNGREPHSWNVTDEEGAEVLWVLVPAIWST
jgi:transcriptional regulator with XRE-family HTH domain